MTVLAAVTTTAVATVAVQASTGRWSLHTTLDAGGALAIVSSLTTVAVCLPMYGLFGGTPLLCARAGAVTAGALIATPRSVANATVTGAIPSALRPGSYNPR